ncbi:MAG: PKD domain-containing protein, partial [Thermoplasmata archaeon]
MCESKKIVSMLVITLLVTIAITGVIKGTIDAQERDEIYKGMLEKETSDSELVELWNKSLDCELSMSPPVTDSEGNIYVISAGVKNNTLTKLDKGGDILWNFKFHQNLFSSIAFDTNENLYFKSMNSSQNGFFVYSLSPEGDLRWKKNIKNGLGVIGTPKLMKGKLYFGSDQGRILVLNTDGHTVSEVNITEEPITIAEVTNDSIFVINNSTSLMKIDYEYRIIWTKHIGADIAVKEVEYSGEGVKLLVDMDKENSSLYQKIISLDQSGNIDWTFDLYESYYTRGFNIDDKSNTYLSMYSTSGSKLIGLNNEGNVVLNDTIINEDVISSTPLIFDKRLIVGAYSSDDFELKKLLSVDIDTYDKNDINISTSITSIPVVFNESFYFTSSKECITSGKGTLFRFVYTTRPDMPKNLTADIVDSKIDLSWDPPELEDEYLEKYNIYRGRISDNLEFYTSTQSTRFSDTSVEYGQTYYYQVSAVNPVGEGNRSEIVSATLEDKKNPIAVAGDDRTVKVDEEVTFNAFNSSDNVEITSYEWDFDDGTTDTGEIVKHKFEEKGTYEVTLTVTDEA